MQDQRLPQTGQETEKRKCNHRCLPYRGRLEGGFRWCLPWREKLSRCLWFPPRMFQSVKNLPGGENPDILRTWRLHFTRCCGTFWSFLLLSGSGHAKVFTYLLISSVSPKRESNTHPQSAERTGPENRDNKWAEEQSATALPAQGRQVLRARGSSPEESHVECEGAWTVDKNNTEQPGSLCLQLLQPFGSSKVHRYSPRPLAPGP